MCTQPTIHVIIYIYLFGCVILWMISGSRVVVRRWLDQCVVMGVLRWSVRVFFFDNAASDVP